MGVEDNYSQPPAYNQQTNYNQPPAYNQQTDYSPPPAYSEQPPAYDNDFTVDMSNAGGDQTFLYTDPSTGKTYGFVGKIFSWDNPDPDYKQRNSFIRKVLLILVAQLLLVAMECIIFYAIPGFNDYVQHEGWWIYLLSVLVEVIVLIPLFIFRHKKPINLVLLLIFTLSTGTVVAITVCFFEASVVIEAAVITILVTAVLMGYTLISKADFRFLAPFLFCALFSLIFFGFFNIFWVIFWPDSWYWLNQIYCIVGILIFVGYILFDTSRLVHGGLYERDEYILASINLYLDILNLFILLLSLLGGKK